MQYCTDIQQYLELSVSVPCMHFSEDLFARAHAHACMCLTQQMDMHYIDVGHQRIHLQQEQLP